MVASQANNYSVYQYSNYITEINGSLNLLASEITDLRSLVRKKPGVDVIHVGNRYDLLPLFKEHRQWREFMKICRKLKLKHYGRTPDFRRFYSDEKEIERVIDGLRSGGFTVCIYKKMYDVKSIDNV